MHQRTDNSIKFRTSLSNIIPSIRQYFMNEFHKIASVQWLFQNGHWTFPPNGKKRSLIDQCGWWEPSLIPAWDEIFPGRRQAELGGANQLIRTLGSLGSKKAFKMHPTKPKKIDANWIIKKRICARKTPSVCVQRVGFTHIFIVHVRVFDNCFVCLTVVIRTLHYMRCKNCRRMWKLIF